MTWEERKRIKEDNKDRIRKLSDKDKLKMLIDLLRKEDNIDMLTSDSDTHGINFTEEYNEWEKDMEELLEALDE